MTQITNYEKRGYLNQKFCIFHLVDKKDMDFAYHYHDFDKIVIFIRGKGEYIVEGKSYELKPYDIVLVNQNEIHKPSIDPSIPYERIIIYFSRNFIEAYKTDTYDLGECFHRAREAHSNVLRIPSLDKSILYQAILKFEQAFLDTAYANELYRQVLFLEFMIHLNRAVCENHLVYLDTNTFHPKIAEILSYINEHLTSELSIELLSRQFYLSRYHMMRLFKESTGYSMNQYITNKRLLKAKEALKSGLPLTQICFNCGFKDYSTFYRAFSKLFGTSPRALRPRDMILKNQTTTADSTPAVPPLIPNQP